MFVDRSEADLNRLLGVAEGVLGRDRYSINPDKYAAGVVAALRYVLCESDAVPVYDGLGIKQAGIKDVVMADAETAGSRD